jgi:hypothetical protein
VREQGIGYELREHVFALACILTEQIGCRFVKVNAKKDPRPIWFYETYGGFVKITERDDTVRMVIDLNKISEE